MDVTRAESIGEAMKSILEHFGGIDVVVNNAGVTIVGAAHALAEDEWDRELART